MRLAGLRKKFHGFIVDQSIVKKNIALFIVMIIFLLIISMGMYYWNTKNVITDEMQNTYAQLVDQYVSSINFKLDAYSYTLFSIVISDTTQDKLMEKSSYYTDYDKDLALYTMINGLLGNQKAKEIINIIVYSENDVSYIGRTIRSTREIKNQEWYQKLKINARTVQWFINEEGVLSLAKPISSIRMQNPLQILGLILFKVDMQKLFATSGMNRNTPTDYSFFIVDQTGDVLFANKAGDWKSDYQNIRAGEHVFLPSENKLMISESLKYFNWRVVFLFSTQSISDKTNNAVFITALAVLLSGLACIAAVVLYTSRFSHRLSLLLSKINNVKKGQLDSDLVIAGHDEIAIVDQSFEDMLVKLRKLINDNYLQNIAKKESELMALQMQINPHFLYNTLECISSLSNIRDCPEIGEIAVKLGEMLRYNIRGDKGHLVALKEEIRQVQNYIDIQKIRFGSRFEFLLDIPEDLEDVRVPQFILQPIIENTFIHGIRETKQCSTVELYAYAQDDTLTLKICDNGLGISCEKLQRIQNELADWGESQLKADKHSVGLSNVNTRIKLLYGAIYGLTVSSESGEGVTVVITIPFTANPEVNHDV